jgi:hypothetical protein
LWAKQQTYGRASIAALEPLSLARSSSAAFPGLRAQLKSGYQLFDKGGSARINVFKNSAPKKYVSSMPALELILEYTRPEEVMTELSGLISLSHLAQENSAKVASPMPT